jgi:hypothetical protein
MYNNSALAASGTTAAGTLAYTGFNTAHGIVAAAALLFAGLALHKLLPKKG